MRASSRLGYMRTRHVLLESCMHLGSLLVVRYDSSPISEYRVGLPPCDARTAPR